MCSLGWFIDARGLWSRPSAGEENQKGQIPPVTTHHINKKKCSIHYTY